MSAFSRLAAQLEVSATEAGAIRHTEQAQTRKIRSPPADAAAIKTSAVIPNIDLHTLGICADE